MSLRPELEHPCGIRRRVSRGASLAWLCVALAAMPGVSSAALTEQLSETTGLRLLVGLPERSAGDGRPPLILWLHGFSLRGDDLRQLRTYGPVTHWPVDAGAYVLVAPQLPRSRLTWSASDLQRLVDEVTRRYDVDPQRRVLMGASLGAAGAWDLAARMPGAFSAVVTVAGTGSVRDVRAARVPHARFFHGEADAQVPLRRVEAAVDAARGAGTDVQLTVLPGTGHVAEAFDATVFRNAQLYRWAFARRVEANAPSTAVPPPRASRPGPTPSPMASSSSIPAAAGADAARLYAWIEALASTPHRRPGTPEGRRAEDWVAARLRELGLEPRRHEFEIDVWSPERTSLSLAGRSIPAGFIANSGFTTRDGVEAELTYVGRGRSGDVNRRVAGGRIVVVEAELRAGGKPYATRRAHAVFDPTGHLRGPVWYAAFPSNLLGAFVPGIAETGEPDGLIASLAARRDAFRNAEEAGAVGVIVLLPDACGTDTSAYWPYDGIPKGIPGVYVGGAAAEEVRRAARAGARATLALEGRVARGRTSTVWALLPGRSSEAVLVTSHHDSVHRGAVEDASGVAQVLAQAARWAAVPAVDRPRTLAFVLAAGHFHRGQGAVEFARGNPDLLARVGGIVTIEHTPAREFRPAPGGGLEATGMPQLSTVYVPDDGPTIARVRAALERAPQPSLTLEHPPFGSIPFTDAAGYVYVARERGRRIPYASWISAPCYLITAEDTPDKVDRTRLDDVTSTVSALVDAFVLAPAETGREDAR